MKTGMCCVALAALVGPAVAGSQEKAKTPEAKATAAAAQPAGLAAFIDEAIKMLEAKDREKLLAVSNGF